MAPSTVFSYWRRDNRRSSASPATLAASSPSSKGANGNSTSSPPQIPEIAGLPALPTSFNADPSHDESPSIESPLEIDPSKLNTSSSTAPLSSSLTLAVPLPVLEKNNRPHSSPGDYEGEIFASQSNSSQVSVTGLRPDQGDGQSNHKPSSPFRRSFGKQKRSPTSATGSGHTRWKNSPEDSPADKHTMPLKESKTDVITTATRRGDRDVSGEQTHHKSGKAMLHLLNPMSLLARRRSAQIVSSRAEDAKIKNRNVPALPDDYDPRIRGKIVHDFSKPRPRRNGSATQQDGNGQHVTQITSQSHRDSWNDQNKEHGDPSPVFKEHFEDQNVPQVENKGYLQSSLLTGPVQSGYDQSSPVSTRNLSSQSPEQNTESVEQSKFETIQPPSTSKAIPHAHSKDSQDQDIIPHIPFNPSGLPRHLKSNASRFSFDMNGVASSTQEKMLEEKHKAKEAHRKTEDGFFDGFDDFDEDFDDDMLDDLDGLEEKIPGVNVDAENDDYDESPLTRNINDEMKSWALPGLSPVVASPIAPALPNHMNSSYFEPNQHDQGSGQDHSQQTNIPPTQPQAPIATKQQTFLDDADDDDLYFDDGDFGDLDVNNQEGGFDESIFDDENSHLYERKPVGALPPRSASNPISGDGEFSSEKGQSVAENGDTTLKHMPSVASDYQVASSVKRGPLGESIPNMGPSRAHGGVLTEQNLGLLHNALAFAANESSHGGRFDRTGSTSERSREQDTAGQASPTIDLKSGLDSDEGRFSKPVDPTVFENTVGDGMYDDFGDSYFDDAIVAAANAEALENDDDGFYGQEFGFYAHSDGREDSEMTNGGYFGPRRLEGITRSHSSGVNFQEPNLTPITERSEWSTRNSMISVKAHGATLSNSALASPGLAQLVDMGNLDDEMSLTALMKLRRGAWGGSNGSLRSSGGSPPSHTLPPSHRTSFTGAEASPTISDGRPFLPDEGPTSVGYFHDDGHPRTTSPLIGVNR